MYPAPTKHPPVPSKPAIEINNVCRFVFLSKRDREQWRESGRERVEREWERESSERDRKQWRER